MTCTMLLKRNRRTIGLMRGACVYGGGMRVAVGVMVGVAVGGGVVGVGATCGGGVPESNCGSVTGTSPRARRPWMIWGSACAVCERKK